MLHSLVGIVLFLANTGLMVHDQTHGKHIIFVISNVFIVVALSTWSSELKNKRVLFLPIRRV